MSQDTISDMLTRIRNANHAKHHYVHVDHTKMNLVLSTLLKRQGFIHDVALKPRPAMAHRQRSRSASRARGHAHAPGDPMQTIVLRLKYRGRFQRPVIHNLTRISGSSLRIYSGFKRLPTVFNGMGTVFVSTSRGVMTDREARRQRLGGEVICSVW